MQIRAILFVFFLVHSLNSFANIDSIGVENNKGKKLIVHKVDIKETYYSLGRRYSVKPTLIMDYNGNKALQPGDVLKIPTEQPFIEANSSQNTLAAGNNIIDYKVAPKDNLFAIAKRFNTTVDDIRQLNNIKGSALSIGQVLKVRQGMPDAPVQTPPVMVQKTEEVLVPVDNSKEEETEAAKTEASSKVPTNRFGLREHSEKGAAVWIDDGSVDGSKLLVLHRTAPVGTVMKITNPMTEKSTFAKVVGKFTENESTKDVIIVVTKATAELVGAMDKRFQVNIDYGLTE